MNAITWLVLAALGLWLGLVLRRIKRKKAAAFGCGGDCEKCLSACASFRATKPSADLERPPSQ